MNNIRHRVLTGLLSVFYILTISAVYYSDVIEEAHTRQHKDYLYSDYSGADQLSHTVPVASKILLSSKRSENEVSYQQNTFSHISSIPEGISGIKVPGVGLLCNMLDPDVKRQQIALLFPFHNFT